MRRSRFSAGTWLALSAGVLAVATLVAVGAALIASHHLTQARQRVVDRVDIATNTALVLTNAMVNQETGIRGFVLGGEEQFLDPYRVGVANASRAQRQLQALARAEMSGRLPGDLAAARRAIDAWESGYARPTIDRIRRFGAGRIENAAVAAGSARFDAVRASLGRLQADLRADRADARADLASAAASLTRALAFVAILLGLALLAIAIIGRQVIAVPIARLARQTRAVASGQLHRVIEPSGPSDIERLGRDVESMRARIVRDLEAVRAAEEEIQEKAVALERSNAELEQFAYVASHDLQEPLRKVTSFCQMIERRYSGQLDERGEQYIAFAVDGAKRMQALINDLLAFSRVGRVERPRELVDLEELVAQATSVLSLAIEETSATVDVRGDLPVVYGERSLLGLVFQNLISNAIKFHGDESPVVRVSARRDGDHWELAVADNGIGIDPEYADRIFVIFQRLHARDVYAGTGIGLTMCRKVIEYHGGEIWLEASQNGAGSTFRFTLPVPDDIATEEATP
ncbi:MAG TPA: ATP-binding protein [Solirubrobacteraceae bacterium]